MMDFYEELGLDRRKSAAEINEDLSKLESTWKRREITNPEKATKMLAMIIDARKAFASETSRQAYDNDLQNNKSQPNVSDPDKERASELSKWKSKAALYVIEKQYDVAKVAIEKALSAANGADDDSLFAMAADIYQRCGGLNTALDYINKAIVLAPNAAYFITKGFIYASKASLCADRPELGDAEDCCNDAKKTFQRAVMAAEKAGDLKNRAIACGALAYICYYYLADEEQGAKYAEMAVAAGGDPRGNADKVLQELNAIREKENEKVYQEAMGVVDWVDISTLESAIAKEKIQNIIAENEVRKQRLLERRKRRKKRFFICGPVIVVAALVTLLVLNIQYHKCGDHLKWKISGRTMTISGTGPMMDDFGYKLKDRERDNVDVLIIENGCTSIGEWDFDDFNSLDSVSLPDSVTVIGHCAFANSESLEQIELPNGLEELRGGAFLSTGITSLYIPASVKIIEGSFPCSLVEIIVDENNTYFTVIDGVLYDHDLTTLIGYPAGKMATNFEVPDGVTSIIQNSGLLSTDKLTSITLPQSLSECDYLYGEIPDNEDCVIHYLGTVEQWRTNPYSEYIEWSVECTDGTYTYE